jgi:hypothetical protein
MGTMGGTKAPRGLGSKMSELMASGTEAERVALAKRLEAEVGQAGGHISAPLEYKLSPRSSGPGTRLYKHGNLVVRVESGNWNDPELRSVSWAYKDKYLGRKSDTLDSSVFLANEQNPTKSDALKDFRAIGEILKQDAEKYGSRGYTFHPAEEAFRDRNARANIYSMMAKRLAPNAKLSDDPIRGMKVELHDLEKYQGRDSAGDVPYMTKDSIDEWIRNSGQSSAVPRDQALANLIDQPARRPR